MFIAKHDFLISWLEFGFFRYDDEAFVHAIEKLDMLQIDEVQLFIQAYYVDVKHCAYRDTQVERNKYYYANNYLTWVKFVKIAYMIHKYEIKYKRQIARK